ncbi:MAG TPA: hypothetical protein VHO94_06165 [Oscillospiraceae bacterium]|nr:hypothetical protein [Oscillospiraceae bacterium]
MISKIVIVLFVIIGLTEFCRVIVMWLYKPRHAKEITMIVPIEGHEEDAEFILKSAAEKMRWMGGKEQKRLICIDCGMDDETKETCKMICNQYSFVEICNAQQLAARLEQKFANT